MISIKKMIIDSVKETLESSSIHALPNIVRNKYLTIKFVWIVCFLVSSAFCGYIIFQSVSDYFNYDIVTKIEVKKLSSINFPMIKICNINPLTTNYSFQWANNSLGISNPKENLFVPFDNITDPFFTQTDNYARFNTFYAQTNTFRLSDSEKKKLGSSLDEFLLMCQFAGQKCNKTNDFEYYFDKINGNCFRYNSGKKRSLLKVVQPGVLNGLNFELLIEPLTESNDLLATKSGFQIFITNQQTEFVFSTGVQVSPGFSTNIDIKKEVSSAPQKPFTNCISNLDSIDSYDSDLYRKTFISRPIYLEDDCKLLCFNKILYNTCNCTDPNFISYYDSNLYCLSYQNLDCEFKLYQKFMENDDFSNCDCPKPCKTITYSYSSSMSKYPTKSYANTLMQNPIILRQFNNNNTLATFDEIRKRVISVNIFYNELTETWITAQPKTDIPSLVSNIGGILGLFLGNRRFHD